MVAADAMVLSPEGLGRRGGSLPIFWLSRLPGMAGVRTVRGRRLSATFGGSRGGAVGRASITSDVDAHSGQIFHSAGEEAGIPHEAVQDGHRNGSEVASEISDMEVKI